ncbi:MULTISPECIES: SCP2 sterol-binding domain-containing protein [unclassified Spirosoma]|uniref:SCP2 sterol-binding domain-containing protein n=1 Tax=unclassified Spirosoma TaxID=2621999 RepID=UPI000959D44D|nr:MULTISPECIES: SCP2 sterol-binding domain-containing protein [unclassified Spirosoma]MBN8825983.1 SCP2 sterol-binding domain-containing protein [Spirosoma sp.]OJW71013.1 MAG: sterol-binding protein [Spirosoma sp. 48-14]
MTLQELTEQIRTKVTHADNINATVKLVTDQGVVYIDATQSPAIVSNEDKPADCDLQVTIDNLVKMSTGDLNPMMAVMMGKLKIKGDMGIAMKMGQIMG